MNKLSSLKSYEALDKAYKLNKRFFDCDKSTMIDFAIPKEMCEDHYVGFKRKVGVPLSVEVYNAVKTRKVIPILVAEEKGGKTRPPIFVSLNTFAWTPGDIVVGVADISPRARYIRNKTDKSIIDFQMSSDNDAVLYAFVEAAYIAMRFEEISRKTSDVLALNKSYVLEHVSAYSFLLSKVINKHLSISASKIEFEILRFLTMMYCLQTHFEFSHEKSINYIFNNADFHMEKEIIETYSKSLANEKTVMKDIDDFLDAMYEEEFYVKSGQRVDAKQLRVYFGSQYGPASMFAIESSYHFARMCVMAMRKINYFNT